MPITWRNINAPNFSGSNQLMRDAGSSINKAVQGVGQLGAISRKQAVDSLERAARDKTRALTDAGLVINNNQAQLNLEQDPIAFAAQQAQAKANLQHTGLGNQALQFGVDTQQQAFNAKMAQASANLQRTNLGNEGLQFGIDTQQQAFDSRMRTAALAQAGVGISNSLNHLKLQQAPELFATQQAQRAQAIRNLSLTGDAKAFTNSKLEEKFASDMLTARLNQQGKATGNAQALAKLQNTARVQDDAHAQSQATVRNAGLMGDGRVIDNANKQTVYDDKHTTSQAVTTGKQIQNSVDYLHAQNTSNKIAQENYGANLDNYGKAQINAGRGIKNTADATKLTNLPTELQNKNTSERFKNVLLGDATQNNKYKQGQENFQRNINIAKGIKDLQRTPTVKAGSDPARYKRFNEIIKAAQLAGKTPSETLSVIRQNAADSNEADRWGKTYLNQEKGAKELAKVDSSLKGKNGKSGTSYSKAIDTYSKLLDERQKNYGLAGGISQDTHDAIKLKMTDLKFTNIIKVDGAEIPLNDNIKGMLYSGLIKKTTDQNWFAQFKDDGHKKVGKMLESLTRDLMSSNPKMFLEVAKRNNEAKLRATAKKKSAGKINFR
jgi:hypothetical protein